MVYKCKRIHMKDVILGVISFPFYIIGAVPYDIMLLIVKPFYLFYLRLRGVRVFSEIAPEWNLVDLMEYMQNRKK